MGEMLMSDGRETPDEIAGRLTRMWDLNDEDVCSITVQVNIVDVIQRERNWSHKMSVKSRTQTCAKCRFFQPSHEMELSECRRDTPPWEKVYSNDWCGKWQSPEETDWEAIIDRKSGRDADVSKEP